MWLLILYQNVKQTKTHPTVAMNWHGLGKTCLGVCMNNKWTYVWVPAVNLWRMLRVSTLFNSPKHFLLLSFSSLFSVSPHSPATPRSSERGYRRIWEKYDKLRISSPLHSPHSYPNPSVHPSLRSLLASLTPKSKFFIPKTWKYMGYNL